MPEHVHLDGAPFLTDRTKGLYEPAGGFESLGRSSEFSSKHNRRVTDAIPYFQEWREAAHQIKKYAIANLDKLLVEFEREHHGPRAPTVLFAENAAEANQLRARHRPRAPRQERGQVEVDGHRGNGAQPRA